MVLMGGAAEDDVGWLDGGRQSGQPLDGLGGHVAYVLRLRGRVIALEQLFE